MPLRPRCLLRPAIPFTRGRTTVAAGICAEQSRKVACAASDGGNFLQYAELIDAECASQISAARRGPPGTTRVRSCFVLSCRVAPVTVIARAADRAWIAW